MRVDRDALGARGVKMVWSFLILLLIVHCWLGLRGRGKGHFIAERKTRFEMVWLSMISVALETINKKTLRKHANVERTYSVVSIRRIQMLRLFGLFRSRVPPSGVAPVSLRRIPHINLNRSLWAFELQRPHIDGLEIQLYRTVSRSRACAYQCSQVIVAIGCRSRRNGLTYFRFVIDRTYR